VGSFVGGKKLGWPIALGTGDVMLDCLIFVDGSTKITNKDRDDSAESFLTQGSLEEREGRREKKKGRREELRGR
jgi:hypothetical protein